MWPARSLVRSERAPERRPVPGAYRCAGQCAPGPGGGAGVRSLRPLTPCHHHFPHYRLFNAAGRADRVSIRREPEGTQASWGWNVGQRPVKEETERDPLPQQACAPDPTRREGPGRRGSGRQPVPSEHAPLRAAPRLAVKVRAKRAAFTGRAPVAEWGAGLSFTSRAPARPLASLSLTLWPVSAAN